MHVILTIDYSPWSAYGGGAQRSTHNLGVAMARRGHDVTVIYTKPPWETVPVPDDLPYAVRWAPFFDVKSRRRAPLRPLNAFAVARVARRVMAEHPHADLVVHSNGEEGGRIHRLRGAHRFAFVATPRHPHYPEALLNPRSPSWWTTLRLALTEGKYLMQGSAARHADLCVPPSAFAADLVRRAFDLDPARVRVVHNGVPREFLAYEHDPQALADGPVVFFGRFDRTKGVDTFVDALHRLDAADVPALVVGRGPEKETLAARIRRYGLDDRVRFRPWMTHDELGRTLATARMAVLPSREENFSLAVLSAMAVGTPTISTRVGGTPEIIDHDATGLLVPPDRPDALAAAMRRLIDDPERAGRIGRAGRRHVRTHLTWDVAAERFEALYCEVLDALADDGQPARAGT